MEVKMKVKDGSKSKNGSKNGSKNKGKGKDGGKNKGKGKRWGLIKYSKEREGKWDKNFICKVYFELCALGANIFDL